MRFSECKTIQELTISWQKAMKDNPKDLSEINRDYTIRKQELLNRNKYTLNTVEQLVPISITASLKIGKNNFAELKDNILEITVPLMTQEFKDTSNYKENTFIFKTNPYPSFCIK